MKDVWGEELNLGDFVLILNQTLYRSFIEDATPDRRYGIVVSSSSVYNGDGVKRYHYLYKIDILKEAEKGIYQSLTTQYHQLLDKQQEEKNKKKNRKRKKVNITRGDIVYGDTLDDLYLYLGYAKVINSFADKMEGHCYIKVCQEDVIKYKEYLNRDRLEDLLGLYKKDLYDRYSNYKLYSGEPFCFINNNFKVLKKPSLLLSNFYRHFDIQFDCFVCRYKVLDSTVPTHKSLYQDFYVNLLQVEG